MSAKEPKNVAASVLERLRNKSKSSGAPFQQVLQQYAIERFLHRISKSKHAKGVVLKGALLLKTIGTDQAELADGVHLLDGVVKEVGERDGRAVPAILRRDPGVHFRGDELRRVIQEDSDRVGHHERWHLVRKILLKIEQSRADLCIER